MNDFVQVHAKAEGDDGGLQQELRQAFAFNVKGMGDGESVNQAAQKREGRRDQASGGEDQCQEEDVLAHGSSLQRGGSGVQAVVLMGD